MRGRGILRTSPYRDSANFAFTEFYEIRVSRVLRSLPEMAHWLGKMSAWLVTSSKRGATMQVLRKMGGVLLLPESDGARR